MNPLAATAFALGLAVAASGAGAVEEVPFIATPDNVILAMLQLAKVGPEDYVIDLGSGDGRIVIMAAKRFGARGLGVEIVPELVEKSRQAASVAGVAELAHFREQDLFKADLSPASVVTLYLLPEVNLQLRPRILQLRPGTRIVSHDWDMADWEPDRSITVAAPDKTIGREKSSRVHLWIVPAHLDGEWCGLGKHRGTTLAIAQSFQKLHGELATAGDARAFDGKIDGAIVRVPGGLAFTFDGVRLKATYATGKYSPLHNATFTRRRGQTCK
ncbi:MAG: methyltransferase domain-containing protein [Usitatibacter sp.]